VVSFSDLAPRERFAREVTSAMSGPRLLDSDGKAKKSREKVGAGCIIRVIETNCQPGAASFGFLVVSVLHEPFGYNFLQ